jgi:acyl transferase domain-containing protein
MRQDLIGFVMDREEWNPADLEYTLQEGREDFPVRLAVSCSDRSSALEGLKTTRDSRNTLKGKTAFLFPGQGSQHNRMGMDLYENDPVYKKYFDSCCDKLINLINADLRTFLFAEEGTQEADKAFRYAYYVQPAIFSLQYSLARSLMDRGVVPEALAGHSIGEYTAACIAGVLSLDDALALVAARGRVMEDAGEGAMTAAGLTSADAASFLKGRKDLSLGVVNGDDQVVLSGTIDAVNTAEEDLKKQGIITRRVNVKQAFHSAMMDRAAQELVKEARKVSLAKPEIPLLSNLTGTWMTDREACDPEYWGLHMRGTVRFADNVKVLLQDKPAAMLEVGSHRILSKLMKSLSKGVSSGDSPLILSTLRHPKDNKTSDSQAFGQVLGDLWAAGLPVDLKAFRSENDGRRIPLPGIHFDPHKCWKQSDADWSVKEPRQGKIMDIAQRGYMPSWTRKRISGSSRPGGEKKNWLVFSDPEQEALAAEVSTLLESQGDTVRTVYPSAKDRLGVEDGSFFINPGQPDQFGEVLKELESQKVYPHGILYFWGIGPADCSGPDVLEKSYYPFLNLAKALSCQTVLDPMSLWVITDNTFQVDDETVIPEKSAVLGPAIVLPQENPQMTCHVVDVQPARVSLDRLAGQIFRECVSSKAVSEAFIVLRGVNRWVQSYEPVSLDPVEDTAPIEKNGTYIITGGLGRIGRSLSAKMAEQGARVVLTTTREFPAKENWKELLAEDRLDEKMRTSLEHLIGLEERGGQFRVVKADFGDEWDVAALLEYTVQEFDGITGIFHAAGTADLKSLPDTSREISEREFASKINALWNLDKAVALCREKTGIEPGFILLFSSMASILGGYSMTAYAAANRFMDTFAQSRCLSEGPSWIAVNWDDWDFDYTKEQVGAYEKTTAQYAMSPDEGYETVQRILSLPDPVQILVSTRPLEPRVKQWIHQYAENCSATLSEATESAGHEERILDIFRDVLGDPDLVPEDNFFDAGGDSLLASQILLKLRRNMKEHADRITLNSIFDYPSVKDLVGWLQ